MSNQPNIDAAVDRIMRIRNGMTLDGDAEAIVRMEISAREERIQELEGALDFLLKTKWKSVDKDNMEFEGRVTCYQIDRARTALQHMAGS